MTIPQPFQYQGSERALAPLILPYLPAKFRRLVESFAGSGAMSLACAARADGGEAVILQPTGKNLRFRQ